MLNTKYVTKPVTLALAPGRTLGDVLPALAAKAANAFPDFEVSKARWNGKDAWEITIARGLWEGFKIAVRHVDASVALTFEPWSRALRVFEGVFVACALAFWIALIAYNWSNFDSHRHRREDGFCVMGLLVIAAVAATPIGWFLGLLGHRLNPTRTRLEEVRAAVIGGLSPGGSTG